MEYSFEKNKILAGIGGDDEYWRGLERGEFLLSRCPGCGKWIWPANYRCAECGTWGMEWVQVEPRGIIWTWSRSWYAFDRIKERPTPFVTVVTTIPACGDVRVLGILKGSEEGLRIGASVHGEIDPPSETTKGYASIRWILDR